MRAARVLRDADVKQHMSRSTYEAAHVTHISTSSASSWMRRLWRGGGQVRGARFRCGGSGATGGGGGSRSISSSSSSSSTPVALEQEPLEALKVPGGAVMFATEKRC